MAVPLTPEQGHQLKTVLRVTEGQGVRLFNGRDGEWHATILATTKRETIAQAAQLLRAQPPKAQTLAVYVAGIKKQRFHWAVEKLTEIGATDIYPLITEYTQTHRFQHDKLAGLAITASEQCASLTIPTIHPAMKLSSVLAKNDLALIIPDEAYADPESGAALTLPHIRNLPEAVLNAPLGVIIGPEGGFSDAERALFAARDNTLRVGLGHRILRTETAVIVTAAAIQSHREGG